MDSWVRTVVGLGTVVAVVGVPLVFVLVVTGRWNPLKALLGLWGAAKAVRNPVLRLLAMMVAGYVIFALFIPVGLIYAPFHGRLSGRGDSNSDFVPNDPMMSPLDKNWGDPWSGYWD